MIATIRNKKASFVILRMGKATALENQRRSCPDGQKSLSYTKKHLRKAIYGKLRGNIGLILRGLCEYKHVEIIEGLMPCLLYTSGLAVLIVERNFRYVFYAAPIKRDCFRAYSRRHPSMGS